MQINRDQQHIFALGFRNWLMNQEFGSKEFVSSSEKNHIKFRRMVKQEKTWVDPRSLAELMTWVVEHEGNFIADQNDTRMINAAQRLYARYIKANQWKD